MVKKQADKPVIRAIIWLWSTLSVLNGFILHIASIALTRRTANIYADVLQKQKIRLADTIDDKLSEELT